MEVVAVLVREYLHHLCSKETPERKGRLEPHKDAAGCFEHILEAAPHKTAVVQLNKTITTKEIRTIS